MTYCTKMIENPNSSAKMKSLAEATIEYCTASQIYFEYGDYENLTVSSAVTDVQLSDLEQYKAQFLVDTLPAGVTRRTISAVIESDNSLRLNFYYDEGIDPDDYTYTIDSVEAEVEKLSDRAYLEISNVASNLLGDTHTMTISDGDVTYTVMCSVLTYARASVANGNETRQNLGKAMYVYNQAAIGYFGE